MPHVDLCLQPWLELVRELIQIWTKWEVAQKFILSSRSKTYIVYCVALLRSLAQHNFSHLLISLDVDVSPCNGCIGLTLFFVYSYPCLHISLRFSDIYTCVRGYWDFIVVCFCICYAEMKKPIEWTSQSFQIRKNKSGPQHNAIMHFYAAYFMEKAFKMSWN